MKTNSIRQENDLDIYEVKFKNNEESNENNEKTIHIIHYRNWEVVYEFIILFFVLCARSVA